jgi:type 1 glutamine amidotransferase
MEVINYAATKRLLTVTRGHPYDREAFAALFAELDDFDVMLVEQPAAQSCLVPAAADRYDAILCYDMPGLDFSRGHPVPGIVEPGEAYQEGFLAMLELGVGMVFMHHALAAWPSWPVYAEIVGGRFHYRPSVLRGEQWPDSGYRHKVEHMVSVLLDHPVTDGIPGNFQITDELYLCPVFEGDVVPLLRSDFTFNSDHFYSAAHAVAGDMNSRQGWQHPAGSSLVGWVKSWGNSPIVYLQGGDDAQAMGNEHFRRLVHNAVRWVSSEQAHAWARGEMN